MSLEIKKLTKAFGDNLIFKDFSYTFEDTGIYALIGDSGVGKTTLLRIISGLDKEIDGCVSGGDFKNVSVAFQEYRLFPKLTLIQNLTEVLDLKSEEKIEKVKKMLVELGFSKKDFSLFPSELSGGMKQRVSIARAFLKPCPVLLLDEPTKELDFQLRDTLLSMIKSEAEKRLVIMVTHNAEDISALDAKVVNLNEIRAQTIII